MRMDTKRKLKRDALALARERIAELLRGLPPVGEMDKATRYFATVMLWSRLHGLLADHPELSLTSLRNCIAEALWFDNEVTVYRIASTYAMHQLGQHPQGEKILGSYYRTWERIFNGKPCTWEQFLNRAA